MTRHAALWPRALRVLLAALPLLLLWPALRHTLEGRMSLHMLLEFPLLFASGWAVQRLGPRIALVHWLDWRGWTGATLSGLVAASWMLPSLLDLSLMSPGVAAAKVASWWLAGWLLADSWRRLDPEVLLFFVGNMAWMTATAGMLYLDTPQQLCVNYLQNDQRHAGIGLMLLAIALGAMAVRRAMKASGSPNTASSRSTAARISVRRTPASNDLPDALAFDLSRGVETEGVGELRAVHAPAAIARSNSTSQRRPSRSRCTTATASRLPSRL